MKKINRMVAWIMILSLIANGMLLNACVNSGGGTKPGTSGTSSISSDLLDPPSFNEAISSFDDGYSSGASWIWADTEVEQGQWVALRKTFYLDKAPTSAIRNEEITFL